MPDFTTCWLGLSGLLLEIVGLGFLFYDLLSTKQSDRQGEALETFLAELQSERRNITSGMAEGIGQVIKVAAGIASLKPGQPFDDAIREALATGLQRASGAFPTDVQISRMREAEVVAEAEIVRRFQRQEARARKLMRAARLGVGLVLLGACLQFADLWL